MISQDGLFEERNNSSLIHLQILTLLSVSQTLMLEYSENNKYDYQIRIYKKYKLDKRGKRSEILSDRFV